MAGRAGTGCGVCGVGMQLGFGIPGTGMTETQKGRLGGGKKMGAVITCLLGSGQALLVSSSPQLSSSSECPPPTLAHSLHFCLCFSLSLIILSCPPSQPSSCLCLCLLVFPHTHTFTDKHTRSPFIRTCIPSSIHP